MRRTRQIIALLSLAFCFSRAIVSLLLSCILPKKFWNLFILLPLIAVPVPYILFAQGETSGWKSFAEFLSGFLFSASWAVIGILFHADAINAVGFWLGLLANSLFFLTMIVYFYWEKKEAFSDGF